MHMIPTFTRWITHEQTLVGFSTKFGLLFLRYHGKMACPPHSQMRDIRLLPIKNLERSDTARKSICGCEILKVSSCQCHLAPVSHRKLSGNWHGMHLPLNWSPFPSPTE